MANLRVDKITSTETFEKTGSVQFGSGKTMKLSANSGFDLTDNDFTVECWMCMGTIQSFQQLILYTVDGTEDDTVWQFDITSTQLRFVAYVSNSSEVYGTNFSFESGTWYHIAATRTNDLIRLFVDGDLIGTHLFASTIDTEASAEINIGFRNNQGTADRFVEGNLSNIRIVKGTALYTSNFKPSMRELEVVPDTVLLCCQSKTDASLEKTGKTITITGGLSASELTPGILTPVVKSGGGSAITGSVEFDGTGDYLSLAANSDFNFGSDNFTIEGFFYKGGATTLQTLLCSDKYYIAGNDGNWILRITSGTQIAFASYNGTGSEEYTEFSAKSDDGGWHHFAFVREGTGSNQSKFYFDGVHRGSMTVSKSLTDAGTNGLRIGEESDSGPGNNFMNGFLSNIRIVNGTALYTADFIPPTRELKNVPGTVLLCCQDSDSPLTEATGKTITPYGSLGDGSLGQELVTRDGVWTLTKGGSGATDWTVSNSGSSLAGTTVASGFIRATYTLDKGDYLVSLRWTGGAFAVQDSTGYVSATDGTDSDFSASEDGAYSFYMSDTTSVIITGTSWSTSYTVDDISIKRIYRNNGGSNFTPQVGDDRQVTFEGVTKIDTDAYFYLPTGNTESREATGTYNAGARGLFTGGYDQPALTDTIDYITISSTGNALDFGNLTDARLLPGALASSVRGIIGGGTDPSASNIIDYVTIPSTGNANDFGDLTVARRAMASFSNNVRGIWAGGDNPSRQTTIDYVTISSTGNAATFGILGEATNTLHGTSSPTRGLLMGGETGSVSPHNAISYVTISTTGSNKDFGDLTQARRGCSSCSSPIRALTGGGNTGSVTNTIDFVTIATTGNAFDFGDLTQARWLTAATSNSIRGVWGGGYNPSPAAEYDIIDYITIASTGNATDFGNLQTSKRSPGACSNGHGGLG